MNDQNNQYHNMHGNQMGQSDMSKGQQNQFYMQMHA